MKKTALITGITGQDGRLLADFLLKKDYKVFGLKRRTSGDGYGNISSILEHVDIVEGDLLDQTSLNAIIKDIKPDECYNLAAMSHVGVSFGQPINTAEITGLGVMRMLEAIKIFSPNTKFYQASSSEMFGKVQAIPQNEKTTFYPRSPYGVAKLFGHWTAINYREAYGLFTACGILYNHSSIYRGHEFATRKITSTAAKIFLGKEDKLVMGNIDSKRDESHAKDCVEGMWLMLQQDIPDDYVLASGETHSIKEMIEVVFDHLNLNWKKYIEIDPRLYRPAEVDMLLGDSSKARRVLGWKPKYNWKQLLIEMVENDVALEKNKK